MRRGSISPFRAGALLGALLAASSTAAPAGEPKKLSEREKAAVLKSVLTLTAEGLGVSAKAETRLLKAGKRIVPYLCELLASEREDIPRPDVVKVLGEIGDKRAVQSVALMTTAEHSLGLRRMAVDALSRIGGKGVAKYFVRLLGDKQMVVSHAAFQGLTRLIQARRSNPSATGELADLLLAALPEAEGQARVWLIALLGETREKAAARPLLQLVRSGPPEVRLPAVKALVRIGDKKTAARLLALLRGKDLDARLRDEIASALGSLADEDLAPEMVDLMADKPELAKPLAKTLSKVTGKRIGPSPHAWQMYVTKKYEGDEGVRYALGIETAEPEVAPPGEEATGEAPSAAEARAAEPEQRRISTRLITMTAMVAFFLAVIGGHKVYSRLKKPKRPAPRRKKTR